MDSEPLSYLTISFPFYPPTKDKENGVSTTLDLVSIVSSYTVTFFVNRISLRTFVRRMTIGVRRERQSLDTHLLSLVTLHVPSPLCRKGSSLDTLGGVHNRLPLTLPTLNGMVLLIGPPIHK